MESSNSRTDLQHSREVETAADDPVQTRAQWRGLPEPGVFHLTPTDALSDGRYGKMEDGRYETVGASPDDNHKLDKRTRESPLRQQAKKVVALQPREKKVVWRPHNNLPASEGAHEGPVLHLEL
ncbi:hypothetical protein DUI87_08062 [Hirundo rustica rustica]|uniref:Uncharacterized protein n=1 Tax=Hirundo rustica rustica TaxID=333673 RepID=A0A3M0L9D4_HIRRU|nr:hypothetical protein DUI87_08062 [Hirundo rustica rustica]